MAVGPSREPLRPPPNHRSSPIQHGSESGAAHPFIHLEHALQKGHPLLHAEESRAYSSLADLPPLTLDALHAANRGAETTARAARQALAPHSYYARVAPKDG